MKILTVTFTNTLTVHYVTCSCRQALYTVRILHACEVVKQLCRLFTDLLSYQNWPMPHEPAWDHGAINKQFLEVCL